MSNGIGLSGFLDSSADDGKGAGGGQWMSGWKEKKELVCWLHTKARPLTMWAHPFITDDEVKERDDQGKETGRMKRVLRFPHFPSPDPKEIHARQYFREKGLSHEPMQTPPVLDPFLLLREWLRLMGKGGRIPLDTDVFEWTDHKKRGSLIQWRLGEISGLVKRGATSYNHSLDSKYEGIFVVVNNDAVDKGAFLTRESKLLTELMRDVIKEQVDSKGEEEGDPTQSPYAFKWVFVENAKSPMDTYKCYRFDRAIYTPEVFAAITSDEYPDPTPHTQCGADDMVKIRAAMQSAMQIDIPLDVIFSEDPAERETLLDPRRCPGPAASTTTSGGAPSTAAAPPAKPGGAKPASSGGPKPPPGVKAPAAPAGAKAAPKATTTATAPAAAEEPKTGGRRRKKAAEPEPEPEPAPAPEPEVERVKCEDCDYMLLPTDAVCPSCGAEYEVDPDDAPTTTATPAAAAAEPAPEPTPAPASKPSGPKPPSGPKAPAATTTAKAGPKAPTAPVAGPKPPGGVKAPPAATAAEPAATEQSDADETGAPSPDVCFACGSTNVVNGVCQDCGLSQDPSDDIPF